MKRNLILIVVSLIVLGFSGASFGQEELLEKRWVETVEGPKLAPGEIIVKFKRGVSQDVIRQINQSHGTSVLSISKRGQFMRLRIPRNRTVEEMVDVYRRNPNVEYAEPNYIAHAFMVPDDPYYYLQWHMGGINAEEAWDLTSGDPGVIVAVIDTGVAYEHYTEEWCWGSLCFPIEYCQAPDLAQTSFVPGYDFVNEDTHPNDDHGHGTHVTGTIAQSTNNGIGVAGVAFNCSIMPVKVLDGYGTGTYADIAEGIMWAAYEGANIINLSLGGSDDSRTLREAVRYAYEQGVTIVCASGNDGSPDTISYPAAYDDYCIAVGATRYDETVAYYSNRGSSLDLVAPGGDLNVDQNGDGYGDGVLQETYYYTTCDFAYWFYQGTSMAAPHVSGVAALLISSGVATTRDEVREALQSTAKDKGPSGWDPDYGYGIVDAYAALNYTAEAVRDVAVIGIAAPPSVLQGDSVNIVVSVANQGDSDESFTVTLTDTTDSTEIGNQSVSLPADGTADLTFTWDTVSASLGNHILEAEADELSGEADTTDNAMTTAVTVSVPVHDVAIVAIDAPLEANEGALVLVHVTVENQGTHAETTTVSLDDDTDGVDIGSQPVSVDAGDSTLVSFTWDTAAASGGDHVLRAEAGTVSGETDTDDNSMTVTATIIEQLAGPTMHVSDITIELQERGRDYQATAHVTVVDESGTPLREATVTGDWTLNGDFLNTVSKTTNRRGTAKLSSARVRASLGDVFTITITDAVKDGYTYDPASNTKTSDSVTVP